MSCQSLVGFRSARTILSPRVLWITSESRIKRKKEIVPRKIPFDSSFHRKISFLSSLVSFAAFFASRRQINFDISLLAKCVFHFVVSQIKSVCGRQRVYASAINRVSSELRRDTWEQKFGSGYDASLFDKTSGYRLSICPFVYLAIRLFFRTI